MTTPSFHADLRERVSVIIPCHNAERFLPETLDSVWRQTYPHVEVILVDDGSTDGTRELIRSCGDRVKALFSENRGAAAARNAGVAAASGAYLQFLDADDLLAPLAIESRVRALLRSGASVAYSDWQYLNETSPGVFADGARVERRIEDIDSDVEVALFTRFWSPPAALLYSRDIVERIGDWKQHLAPIEDARYLLDAALAGGRFEHVPGIGAHYRVFEGPSHSRRDPLRFVQSVLANALEVESLWRRRGPMPEARAKALAGCYDYVSRSLFRADAERFAVAMEHLRCLRPGLRPIWPRAADALRRSIGHGATLRVLAWLGRPAP